MTTLLPRTTAIADAEIDYALWTDQPMDVSTASIEDVRVNEKRIWRDWAETNIVPLVAISKSPHDFCVRAHALFLKESGQCKFKNYKHNFIKSLIEGDSCNCVCGTLLLLACAEYVGLYPHRIHELCTSKHIWVTADRSPIGAIASTPSEPPADDTHRGRDTWSFIETTLRPKDADDYIVSEREGSRRESYAYGMWKAAPSPTMLIQECFINDYVSAPKDSKRRTYMTDMLFHIATTVPPDSIILDVHGLHVCKVLKNYVNGSGADNPQQQLTKRQRLPLPIAILERMMDRIEACRWGPETCLRNLLTILKAMWFFTFAPAQLNDDAWVGDDVERKLVLWNRVRNVSQTIQRRHRDAQFDCQDDSTSKNYNLLLFLMSTAEQFFATARPTFRQ